MSRRWYLHPFLYAQMEVVIDDILSSSTQPPVILIQGDHGPGLHLSFSSFERSCLRERLPILSAYYLPAGSSARPYPAITPVNSFRVVFNAVFGGGLPLLPDASFYSTWDTLYDFVPAGDRVSQPCTQFIPPSDS